MKKPMPSKKPMKFTPCSACKSPGLCKAAGKCMKGGKK